MHQVLVLQVLHIYHICMKLLSQMCTINAALRVLDISRTYIGSDGANCFANIRNSTLCDLKLVRCKLGPTGADRIGKILFHNCSIVSLDISGNNIKDSGLERLVYHLNATSKLKQLNLSGNIITSIGISHLKSVLAIRCDLIITYGHNEAHWIKKGATNSCF